MIRISAVRGLVLPAAILLAGGVSSLEAQGLTARLSPEVSSVWWAGDVGLQDTRLFGGGLTLGFGRYVSLRGSYERANSVRTSLLSSGYGGGAALENSLDASLFSTGLQLRLGNSRIAPILTGVGGVLAVAPDGRETARQVVVGYGGGLDARLTSWLDAQVLVQDLRFRMDRSSLAGDPGSPIAADSERGDLRRSTAVTAALSARLGGTGESSRSNQLDQDMSRAYSGDGLMIPIEMQVGVMRFSDGLDIDDRGFAGVRAGFDFGPYFGLRGSYARGIANGYGSFVGMTSWSGEGQFNLGRVTSLTPHLLLGFGQLTFADDFRNRGGVTPEDQNALIVGAGVGVPLSSRMRFIVTLRDHITSAGSASGVSSTTDLRHNFGLSGGLSYLIRRGPVQPRPSPTGTLQPVVAQPAPVPQATPEAPAPTPVATQDTSAASQTPSAETPVAGASTDGSVVAGAGPRSDDAVTAAATGTVDYHSDRTISIPVPRQGELYIRYGPPVDPSAVTPVLPGVDLPETQAASDAQPATDVNPSQIAELVRAEVERATAVSAASVASAAQPDTTGRVTRTDLADLEERLAGRLAAISNAASVASAAQSDTTGRITRTDLADLEERLAGRLAATSDAASLASAVQSDTTGRVTRSDLADLEERLSGQLAAISDAEARRSAAPAAAAQSGAEMEALARQVDELSRLVREGMTQGQGQGALIVPVSSGEGATEIVTEMRAPFFEALELRAGSSSVRNSGPGMGVALETSLGLRFADRLQPFAALHLGQASVDGQIGGSPFAGSVTSYGATTGLRMSLPDFRSVAPAVSVGVSAVAGGTRGDTPAEASVIDDLYGGFVMGPRVALTGEWKLSEGSPLQLVGSVAKLWAGSRGGWSFQTGVRWSRPSVSRTVVRPVVQTAITSAASAPPASAPTSTPGTSVTQPETQTAPPAPDPALLTRLQELEEALQSERTAREQMQRAADSTAAQSRSAQARADSLARVAAAADRERMAAEATRAEFRRSLEALVGVVPDVQSVGSTARGLEVSLGGGIFPTGATDLPPAARAQVERVGRVLAQGPDQRLLVNGHTDSTGSAETNLDVSRLRAEAVRAVLVDVGVDPSLISVLASGEDVPVGDNETREGRSRNRRVEVVVLGFDAR